MNQSSAASDAFVFLRAINLRKTANVTIMAIAMLVFMIVSPRLLFTAILLVMDDKLVTLQMFEHRKGTLSIFEFENRSLYEIQTSI